MTIVLVNLVYLDPARNGGVSRIAYEVAHLLCAMQGVEVVFAVGAGFVNEFPAWLGQKGRVIPYLTGQPPTPLMKALKPDFIISPLFGIEPFEGDDFKRAVHVTGVPDALALDKPELFLPQEREARVQGYTHARQATVIVTLSEHARQRLLAHWQMHSERIRVVKLGADFQAPQSEEWDRRVSLQPQPYVFYPANNWPHKRHALLFTVMAEVWKTRPELNLVLTGGRSGGVALEALIASAPAGRVNDLRFVEERQLQSLYAHAEALMFMSEHEGFGMPVVEAMLNGCPVICAPVTALPEVAGEAALYVDTDNPRVWATALLDELPQRRAMLIEAGKRQAAQFTWAKARAGWAAALKDAGLRPDAKVAELSVPLDMVLEELERWRKQTTLVDSSIGQQLASLEQAMQRVDAVRLSENQYRWAGLPGIGFVVRTLLRVRNLGHMWEANAHLNRALYNQLAALEARLREKKD